MSRYRKDLGDFGELVAENFFKESGYKILEKKFSVAGGEIDLIVESEQFLVFVEVKTRSSIKYGYPVEAITPQKLLHMKRAAEAYLLKHPCDKEIRFDAIEVFASYVNGFMQLEKVNHIPEILL